MKPATQLIVIESDTDAARRAAVERVILEMRDHLADPLSLQEMARIAGVSPFHFERIFREITGIPPVQFLYALRIEAAKRLLLTTKLPVTDVCYEVGYNSLGTFTRRFTELVGLSPGQFRSLAETVSISLLQSWVGSEGSSQSPVSCVTGQLIAAPNFSGITFLGLFRTAIPQGHPVSGMLLTAPGPFHFGPIADGKYFLFAAAFPYTPNLLAYLLPQPGSLFVGSGGQPAVVRNGKSDRVFDVRLRETRTTDPPILISLPFLLAIRSQRNNREISNK
jgi:AraC family transcriptional regulator